MATKWVKIPEPGQMRGEGEWLSLEEYAARSTNEYMQAIIQAWAECRASRYLPTAEQDERPQPDDMGDVQ